MKKYLVIGKPIQHSLSPKLHNYWIKKNNLSAIYEKKQLNENDIKETIKGIIDEKIHGINVTVPYKKYVIPFLDDLTNLAKQAQSVNTIYKKDNKIIGDNTDVGGFEKALKHINYDTKGKNVFILGAGGVVPSIIIALRSLGVKKIALSNRTKAKANSLKDLYPDLEIIDWKETHNIKRDFNLIINATSLGLKSEDKIKINYEDIGKNNLFYDVIYNPEKTNFLLKAKEFGNEIENGKLMFIYQAQLAFKIWHNIEPKIDNDVIKLLSDD